ncbi:MAG: hypothetical protein WD738_01955 [Pirellulales bacterium]
MPQKDRRRGRRRLRPQPPVVRKLLRMTGVATSAYNEFYRTDIAAPTFCQLDPRP